MQYSIAHKASCTDIGIHTGEPVSLTFKPAPAGHGLEFVRTDLATNNHVHVTPSVFSGENNMTCILHAGQAYFKTVEHAMSAITGLGIDNLIIETSSAEMPAMDGSAAGFLQKLLDAEIIEQNGPGKKELVVQAPIIEQGKEDTFLMALPSPEFKLSVIVEYNEYPFIGTQIYSHTVDRDVFIREIAPARTLGKVKDLKYMWSKDLGLGVTLENAIGISEKGYSCALRYPDEIVRHKVMDLIGDLGGLQKDIKAHIIGYKPNHRLNIQFMKKLATITS